jgi:tetratricopeptide (TPR) repeat protein
MGQFESAAAAYEHALQLAPKCSSAAYSLTDLQLPAPGDPRTRDIERRVDADDLTESDRANFEFALARIYEGAQQYDRAFKHYVNAKEATRRSMRARGLNYDPEGSARYNALIMQRYRADSSRSTIDPLPIRLRPIFIVGMPRSGTTLVEQILSTHPLVSSGGELTAAPRCHELYLERRKELDLDGPAPCSVSAHTALLMEMRERYVEDLFECGLDSEFVIDKLPGNFQLLGFIRMMFPDALIVHCQRAPISTCWSLYTSNFAADAPYCTSQENLLHYYRLYQALMDHWRTILQPPMIEVQYESLVADPENVVRGLLSACDLPWDDRCLKFHKNARPVTTASVVQARQPVFSSSLQRWKPFEAYLGVLRELQ